MSRVFIGIILIALTFSKENRISDLRLCGDPTCSEPVSLAKTQINYKSDDARILSFKTGLSVEIYSKSAGSRLDLWGAKINGQRGYVPKGLVREYKILKKILNYTIPTEYNIEAKSIDNIEHTNKSIEDNEIIESTHDVNIETITEIANNDSEMGASKTLFSSSTASLTSQIPSGNPQLTLFSFKGVSAEPSENKSPSPDTVSKPYDVIDGTTFYYSTDGETEDNINSLVKATSVLHESSATVTIPPIKSEHIHDSGDEKITLTTFTTKLNDKTDDVESFSSKSETENVISGKSEQGNGDKLSQENVDKISVVEDDEVHVTDDEEESDSDDEDEEVVDDDDDEDDDNEEESIEDFGDEVDGEGKHVNDNGDTLEGNVSLVEGISTSEVPPLDSTDNRTKIDDKLAASMQSGLPTPETSNLLPSESVSFDNSANIDSGLNSIDSGLNSIDSGLNLELGLKGNASIELDHHGKDDRSNSHTSTNEKPISSEVPESPDTPRDELVLVDENVTSEAKPSPEAHDWTPNELLGNETLLLDEKVSFTEPSVVGETIPGAVTEMPMSEIDVPPVSYETPTENPLLIEEIVTSPDDKGSSSDQEGSSFSVETSFPGEEASFPDDEVSQPSKEELLPNDEGSSPGDALLSDDRSSPGSLPSDERPSSVQHDNTHVESSDLASPLNVIASNINVGAETTVTKEHTENQNDIHDSEKGAEEQALASSTEHFQETFDGSDHISSSPILERDNSEVESATVAQPDSSAGLFSSITDTLRSGYVSMSGLFWSSVPKELTVSKDEESTASPSTTNEVFLADKKVEEDNELPTTSQSAENFGADSTETRGSMASMWSSLWGKSDVKESTSHPPSENIPETSETCRPDSGVEGSSAEESSPSAMDPYGNSKFQQDVNKHVYKADDGNYLPASNNTIWFMVSTGALVAVFTLGFIYLEKNKLHRSLVAEVNALKKALHIKSIESISKRDEGILDNHISEELHATVTSLQQQLQDSQRRCAELEDKVSGLERELETATETGLELNKMLGDMLSSQQDSDQLVHNMEDLRKQLDTQEAAMKADLAAKTSENEKLQVQLDKVLGKNSVLEGEIEKLKEMLEKFVSEQQELQNRNDEVQAQLSEEQQQVLKVTQELHVARQTLEEVNQALAIKDSELTVLQDCLKQTRAGDGEEEGIDKFQALLDVGRVRAELKMVTLERDALADQLHGEKGSRKLLEDHVEVITKEVAKLRSRFEEAEKDKMEAQTRLEVLSNYFKEKETQLQKELGLQEAMNLQKDGDVVTTFERINLLQDEVENYNGEISSSPSVNTTDSPASPRKKRKPKVKRLRQNHGSQIDTLKKEILDQERGLKSQISALEKKAHENWVAARQAERRLEETKQEAGQLRNRLTIVEKNMTNTSTPNGDTSLKMADRLPSESNGELPMSPPLIDSPVHYRDGLPVSPPLLPPFMLPPPGVPFMPPPAFMPPPPPPMFPGDRRPPPLGRMSSPPPRFSPPPPPGDYSPSYDDRSEDRTPPPYHSPVHFDNSDRYRHRTPPRWDQPVGPRSGFRPLLPSNLRTTPREHKGSAVSSGHSSESLEKSSRHSDNNMV